MARRRGSTVSVRIAREIVFLVLPVLFAGVGSAIAEGQELHDYTASFSITTANERTTLDRKTRLLTSEVDITLQNNSTETFASPLHAVIDAGGAAVTMPGASGGPGTQPYDTYYVELTLNEGQLAPAQSVTFHATFVRAVSVTLKYQVAVYGISEPGSDNEPPTFTSTPLLSAVQYYIYYYQAAASDPEGETVTYSLGQHPSGMILDEATGMLVWTPDSSQEGGQTVEVLATDAQAASTVQQFVVEVETTNLPPEFVSVPDTAAKTGELYSYAAVAVDPENEGVTYALGGSSPGGMTVDPASGVVQWTPGTQDAGTHPVTVEAADPHGATSTQTYSLRVTDAGVPLEVISPAGDYDVSVGQTLTLTLAANYSDAAFTTEPTLTNSSIDENLFTFTPTSEQVGDHALTFAAHLDDMEASQSVTIHVSRTNGAPQFTALGARSIAEGSELHFVVEASDPDGDSLECSTLNGLPENAVFNQLTNEFMFIPSFEQAGDYAVTFTASDGQSHTEMEVPITVTDLEPPATDLTLEVNEPVSPTFQISQTISGAANGELAPAEASEEFVFITGLAPDSVRQAASATVEITGMNTAFAQGVTQADFGSGITVESLEILTPTSARATISAEEQAEVGIREVRLTQNGKPVYSVVAFKVLQGSATISGTVIDPVTQQPVAGARVGINGTQLFVLTDADGNFTLEGVPTGAQEVVITRANYEVLRLDLAISTNQQIALETPLSLDVLARPYQPAGSLPRAQTVASILDRGANDLTCDLTQEQAEEVIYDTMLVVGGSEVGVLDDAGNQLNPKVTGAGMFSLTPEGLRKQADALRLGDTHSIGDVAEILAGAFPWADDSPPTVTEIVVAFQQYIDEAWAAPSDASSAMAFVLFNDGATPTSEAPLITSDTRLNRFQCFLLMTSFLVNNYEVLTRACDAILVENGIDPHKIEARDYSELASTQFDATSTPGLSGAFSEACRYAAVAGRFLGDAVFGGAAYADEGGVTLAPPNGYYNRQMFGGSTYNRVWKFLRKQLVGDIGQATASYLINQALIQGALVLTAGMTGGVTGATIAMGALTAASDGLVTSLLMKYLVGAFVAANLQQLTPEPALPESSQLVDENLVLIFEPAVDDPRLTSTDSQSTEAAAQSATMGFRYTYQLFLFERPDETSLGKAVQITDCVLEVCPTNSKKMQFVIPAYNLKVGANFLRIATVKYLHKMPKYFAADLSASSASDALDYRCQYGYDPKEDTYCNKIGFYTKCADPLNKNQKNAILTDVRAQTDAYLKANDPFYDNETAYERQLNRDYLNKKLAWERLKTSNDTTRNFNLNNRGGLKQANQLENLVNDAVKNGKTLDTTSTHYTDAVKIVGGQPGDTLPSDVSKNLNDLHASTAEREKFTGLKDQHTQNKVVLDEFQAELRKGGLLNVNEIQGRFGKWLSGGEQSGTLKVVQRNPLSFEYDYEYNRVNDAGVPEKVTGRVYLNEWREQATLKTLADTETTKIESATTKITQADAAITNTKNEIVADRVGRQTWQDFQNQKAVDRVKVTELERQTATARQAYELENTQRKAISQQMKENKVNAKVNRTRTVTKYFNSFGKMMQFVNYGAMFLEPMEQLLRGMRLLHSELSPAHMFVLTHRNVYPPPIIMDPAVEAWGGFLAPASDPDPTVTPGKGGLIVSVRPGESGPYTKINAQFPCAYLAVDADGTIFADNGNTNSRFGGRLFRFEPDPGNTGEYLREFAGTINHYSLALQYAHPAGPVAFTVGAGTMSTFGVGLPEHNQLFIADIDYMSDTRRVLMVPVTLAETNSYYEPEANRYGICGQMFFSSSEWRFSGPTCLAAAPVDASESVTGIQRIYLSDEESVFVLVHALASGDTYMRKVVESPGTQWSGLAVDLDGTLYMADYGTGQLYFMTSEELRECEASAIPEAEPRLLRADLSLYRPGAMALDHSQQQLGVSTADGVELVRLPVIVQSEDIKAIRLQNFNKIIEVDKLYFDGKDPYFAIPVSEFDLAKQEVTVSAQVYDSLLNETCWRDMTIPLKPFSMTMLSADDAQQWLHGGGE